MQKTVYEDYKYSMQDTNRLYIGCKYTFRELLEEEDISFKFRLILEKYALPEADLDDTLETHLYYLGSETFLVKIYKQIRAKVKVMVIEERKNLFGKKKKQYVTRQLTMDQLVAMSPAEKEQVGMVVQEFSVGKLAMMSI